MLHPNKLIQVAPIAVLLLDANLVLFDETVQAPDNVRMIFHGEHQAHFLKLISQAVRVLRVDDLQDGDLISF